MYPAHIILLINVKMPIIVGILTFISRINTNLTKARQFKTFQNLSFNVVLKFDTQLIMKKYNNFGGRSELITLMSNQIIIKAPRKDCETETKSYFCYFSAKTDVVGTQKNRLDETVLLSTQNICLDCWIRK